MYKLLIIEDEELMLNLLATALAPDGIDVLKAQDGEEGLQLAREELPQIIITDMSLPKMTGWQLIEGLRDDDRTRDIPIIALTAHATAEDRTAAYAAGVSAYEQKPADIARIKAKITELLESS